MESLTEKIVEKDDTIPELPPKDLVRRVDGVLEEVACIDNISGVQSISRHSIQPRSNTVQGLKAHFFLSPVCEANERQPFFSAAWFVLIAQHLHTAQWPC